jgi:hypothetical protein
VGARKKFSLGCIIPLHAWMNPVFFGCELASPQRREGRSLEEDESKN